MTGTFTCYLCNKEISSTVSSKSSHKWDQHDGSRKRIFPLECQWCDIKPFDTRTGLAKHLARCQGVQSLEFPLSCPYCNSECQGVADLSKHSSGCYSWKQDTSSDESFLDEFDKELLRVVRHPETARYMGRLFEKAELRLEDGEKNFALIIPPGSNRIRKRNGTKSHVHIAKRRAIEVVEETNPDVAIGSHAYGRLVRFEDYKLLEKNDPLWDLPFVDNGELLAAAFEGMLLHSGEDILLAFKVEVYGTADYEDPHAQEVARPKGTDDFKVENVFHDHTRKVMVGTIKWCLLVTLAVMVTDGTVVVGPDNRFFHPEASSSVWIKTKSYDWIRSRPKEDLYNTMPRQLRSKFDREATFESYSAVNRLFNHHTTMPVTLKTLYGFKSKNGWSGVKVAAFVFHQLYTKRKIMKAEIQAYVKEALKGRDGKLCESLKIVQRLVEEMADEEPIPVSKPVNSYLTELAGKLSGEITNLNNTDVKNAVVKKIKSMIL
ncbi:hypothetical protein BG004_007751 [Podila humilis]|nr:hypothetical protein BG004_007751 [Podila humilis]